MCPAASASPSDSALRGYHATAGGTMNAFWGDAAGLRYVQIDPDEPTDDLPLIVAIHGRGANATDLADLAPAIHPNGYRWVLPQGPRPVPIMPGYEGWAW